MSAEPKKTIDTEGGAVHYSVGAIIRMDDKYLLIDRLKPPLGFAAPAGHVDEGEAPEAALVREVFEESGLKVNSFRLLEEGLLKDNICSRGVSSHYWYLYLCEVQGDIVWNKAETKSIGLYLPEQIKELTLEPVWEYWLKKQKII